MPRKTLQVQVALDIQAVTCPGVWLCPKGKVSLQIFLLDSCIQTAGLQPIFPLLCHEKFIFYKVFNAAHTLTDLQKFLNQEYLYAEFIQTDGKDTVLATFHTSLAEVLYPSTYEGSIAGVDVDLLMDPSNIFPGIIAPKIEISTRTTVEEIVCSCSNKKCNAFVVNPKTVPSDQNSKNTKRHQLHQKRVCHSLGYHRARACTKLKRSNKPPFVFRKAKDDLLARKPQGLESGSTGKCNCCSRVENINMLNKSEEPSSSNKTCTKVSQEFSKEYSKPTKFKHRSPQKGKRSKKVYNMCSCGTRHSEENCPLCSKYHYYFEDGKGFHSSPSKEQCRHPPIKESYVRKIDSYSPTQDCYKGYTRSPIRTLSKDRCPCPAMVDNQKPCYCSPRKAIIENSSQATRTCNCCLSLSDDKSSRNLCCCSSFKKSLNLAEQIHRRLRQTLDCTSSYHVAGVECCDDCDNESTIECTPKFQSCKKGLYQNVDKFYKDLRRC